MKYTIFVFALLFGSLSIGAQSSELIDKATLSDAEQDQMTAQAKKLIDDWGGSGSELSQASNLLAKVLRVNPKSTEAHFEMARYFLSSGHINFRNYQPGTLEKASGELNLALQQDPNWGKAYVLLGYIQYLKGDYKNAINLFKKAESLGTDYKWLYIDWGNALTELNDWSGAEIQLNKAKTRKDLSNSELSGLYQSLMNVYVRQRKIHEADKIFKANIALNPNSAWMHGNYADFLLLGRGRPDEAITEASKALKIMDYGMGRVCIGTAQYAMWAELKDKNRKAAKEYLRQAQQNAPEMAWVFPRVGMSVDAGPALQKLAKALMQTGVSIDTTDDNGDTAFTLAAASGNVKAMQWLAKHGANINYMKDPVPSPLAYAIELNDQRTIAALVALRVDVNRGNSYGISPLMLAASKGFEPIVKTLIASGANWNAIVSMSDKRRAEDFALAAGHKSVADYLHSLDRKGSQ